MCVVTMHDRPAVAGLTSQQKAKKEHTHHLFYFTPLLLYVEREKRTLLQASSTDVTTHTPKCDHTGW